MPSAPRPPAAMSPSTEDSVALEGNQPKKSRALGLGDARDDDPVQVGQHAGERLGLLR